MLLSCALKLALSGDPGVGIHYPFTKYEMALVTDHC